jgi:hypothetical protein
MKKYDNLCMRLNELMVFFILNNWFLISLNHFFYVIFTLIIANRYNRL